jgi:pheromone a factor receptor
MGDTVYTVFSAICVLLNIAPLCWQIEHGNSGPVCVGFWVIIMNLNGFVRAAVSSRLPG